MKSMIPKQSHMIDITSSIRSTKDRLEHSMYTIKSLYHIINAMNIPNHAHIAT
jgi:hypothetical protein